MKKENIYIDLSKCSEKERKHIFSLLPQSLSSLQYDIDEYNFMLDYEDDEWWVNGTKPPLYKTELLYPEFIKIFEGGDDYQGKRYQPLFDHLHSEHGLILHESEMEEIIRIVNNLNSNQ